MVVVHFFAMVFGLLFALAARAVTLDDGDFVYTPDGVRLSALYLQHFEGRDLYAKGQKVSGDARLSGDVAMLRFLWGKDWGDVGLVPQFLIPMGKLRTGGALAGIESTNGIGDLLVVCPVHFIKDPSGREAFAIVPYLWLPTGHYDRHNGINALAENRWKFTLQTGRNTALSEKVSLELVGDVQVYGTNDNFGPAGVTMKQNPLYEAQAHLRYFLTPGTYFGAMMSHIRGGERRIDGVAQDDRQSLTKAMFSVGHFVTPDVQLVAAVGRDLSIRNGIREDARLNLRILKIY